MTKDTKFKDKSMADEFAIIKTTGDIRLDKLKAGREAVAKAKSETITLHDFIQQNYHSGKGAGSGEALRVTIKDTGLIPFEIDIYDARIITVEITGKTRKDFEGNDTPERIYRGRCHSMGAALQDISALVGRRKLQALPTSTVTLRDYHNAYAAYWKYVASVVNPAYAKALDALQDKFPFTQISQGRTDKENWFD
jgi:hypothetical protein